jgi:hypothetical protein
MAAAVLTALSLTTVPIPAASAASPVPDVATVEGQQVHYDGEMNNATNFAAAGETLNFSVDYTGFVAGTYETTVNCVDQESQVVATVVPAEAPDGVVDYTANTPSNVNAACSIRVRRTLPAEDYAEPDRYVLVILVPPTMSLLGYQNTSGSAFYPLVAGHPDYWTARFVADHPAAATMTVRTLSGK